MPDDPFIPVAMPDLGGNEESYVTQAIRSSWISSAGPFLDRIERDFAAMCRTRSAVAVTNGTVALHLALLALGVRAGDEVIMPSLTYVATANVARYLGAEPVFVDVDEATWCLDPARVEERITPRTRGIVPVHLYGHPADMDAIGRIAAIHGLWTVEDAAEAHLARYKGRVVGGLGTLGAFSFFGNKTLTCGEGGAVTVGDAALETRLRILRGQGMDPERRYYFPVVGHNFRLTNLAAALLAAQLERAEALLARRREIFAAYRARLDGIPGLGFQPVAPWAEPTPWLFCVTIDADRFGRDRDDLMRVLKDKGIDTRPFFIPLHTLPPYRDEAARRGCDLPVTTRLAASGINLPTYTQLTDADLDRVAGAIRQAARG